MMRRSLSLRRQTIRSSSFFVVGWMMLGGALPGCSSNEGSAANTGGSTSASGANTSSSGHGDSGGNASTLSTTPAQTSIATGGHGASDATGGTAPVAGGAASSTAGGAASNTARIDASGGTNATTTSGGTPSGAGRPSSNAVGGNSGRASTTSNSGGKAAGGASATSSNVPQAGSSTIGRGGSSGSSSATGGAGSSAGGATSVCLDFPPPTSVGTIEASGLNGPSGIVASRSNPGVLYAHLDTGGTATVYAMTTTGKSLGEYAITGATNTDWEDIAVGPGPGTGSYIYVGDIGDNAARTGGTVRKEIQIYRVPEPKVTTTQAATTQSLAGAEVLRFTYPDAAHDAETLIVDPVTGDVLIVTKETDGNSSIFRAPGNTPVNTPTALETLGTVKIGASGQAAMASGGDASPTGDRFVVRSYTALLVFTRASTLAATFTGTPKSIAFATEPQGEGVTFSADGKSIFTAGETVKTIYESKATCP